MTEAQKHCKLIAHFQRLNNPPIQTPAEYLLERGRDFTTRRPTRRGEPQACYENAFRLAARRKTLRYVEGFATGIIPVEHAWCVDSSGNVIDPTWDEEYRPDYFGVEFDLDLVRRVRKLTKAWPVLWAWWMWEKVHPVLVEKPA